jgi:hypothetical protein
MLEYWFHVIISSPNRFSVTYSQLFHTPASGAPVSSSTGHPIVFAMQKWTGRNSGLNGSESLVDILGIVRVLPAGPHTYKYHEFTMSLILALNNQRTVSYLLPWVDQSRLRFMMIFGSLLYERTSWDHIPGFTDPSTWTAQDFRVDIIISIQVTVKLDRKWS